MKINTIKLAIFSQILSLGIIIFPVKILAQPNNCYMEDVNGNPIDLSGLCGGAGSSSSSSSFNVRIKRRHSGIPVVDVIINNSYSYEMLVDTGASGTAFTVEMAKDLDLKPENIVLIQTPSSSAIAMQSTIVESIKVGKGEIRNVEVIVAPSLPFGLLGQDFLGKYNVTIKEDIIEFKRR